MPNGNGLYNLGGGQITSVSQQRPILPMGAATKERQRITGRDVSGTTPTEGQEQGSLMNILDFMKGILAAPLGLLGGLFGGGEGRFGLQRGQTSPDERLGARQRQFGQGDYDYYGRYRESLPGGRRMGPPSPSPMPSVGRGSSSPTIVNVP